MYRYKQNRKWPSFQITEVTKENSETSSVNTEWHL